MVPIVNKPVLGHILDLLKRNEFTEVVITVQYLANLIQDFFGDGLSLGMHIHYSVEETPLGTAGSVKSAQDLLDDTFLVISGDALTNFDLSKLLVSTGQAKSRSEANRLIAQGAVSIDGEKVTDKTIEVKSGCVVRAGKRRFARVIDTD